MPVRNGTTVGFQLKPGASMVCAWFDIAPATDAAGSAPTVVATQAVSTQPSNGDRSQIDSYAYACPSRMPAKKTIDTYRSTCTPERGWQFVLDDRNGARKTMTTDGSGHVGWTDVPSGRWRVRELLPPGFGNPIVFCRYVAGPAGVPLSAEWAQHPAPGGALPGEFPRGTFRIECSWFNLAPSAPTTHSTVEAYKLWCPEGFSADRTLDQLMEVCTFEDRAVAFTLTTSGTSTTHQTTGMAPATWTDVPVGSVTIQEAVPDGWVLTAVWCQHGGEDGFGDAYALVPGDGQVQLTVGDNGETASCAFFNVPASDADDTGMVALYKYACPEPVGTMGSTLEELLVACADALTGVAFELVSASSTQDGVTGSDGSLVFQDVPPGDLILTEVVPAGDGAPSWWCGLAETLDTVSPVLVADGEAAVTATLHGGMVYACVVFNGPPLTQSD
jgi:hypothetical protein